MADCPAFHVHAGYRWPCFWPKGHKRKHRAMVWDERAVDFDLPDLVACPTCGHPSPPGEGRDTEEAM